MNINYIRELEGKKILVDRYFYGLIELGWKYDLKESDLFDTLSKTFWTEGNKASIRLKEYCCVPPNNEFSQIVELNFFAFDISKYIKRDIYTSFKEMQKCEFNTWKNPEEYIAHLEKNYPFYIPNADFNTGIGHDDDLLLENIDINDVPNLVLEDVIGNIKKVSEL